MYNLTDKYLPIVQQFYKKAMNIDELTYRMFDAIEDETGILPHHIIHADSFCSDDINNIEYPEHARIMMGPFNLGGLCGFPFAGKTGISAFVHHVPEHGAVMVYYGPHIGMTKEGELGQLLRLGQSSLTSCCGATIAALNKLEKNEIIKDELTDLDYQQNIIEQILLSNENRIKSASNKIFEATEIIYEAIEHRVNELIVTTDYPCKNIILVGGIIINSDYDVGSYFDCRTFKIIDSDTFKAKDVLQFIYK